MASWCDRFRGIPLLGVLAILLAGCAGPASRSAPPTPEEYTACQQFLERVDQLVDTENVRDSGSASISGFRHLRVNRLLASFTHEGLKGKALSDWLERLRRLDQQARQLEFAKLSAIGRNDIDAATPPGQTPASFTLRCGRRLAALDAASPARLAVLLERARVPDSYVTWQRAVGLYPITRLAISAGVHNLHEELIQRFESEPSSLPLIGRLTRYRPAHDLRLTKPQIREILQSSADNRLGIPEPTAAALAKLFASFAPVWEIDVVDSRDRIGKISLDGKGATFVDTWRPTVYRLVSHTRFEGRVLLQLNYVAWIPERQKTGPWDLYGGPFDGIIWRVTLGPDGDPIAYDSIHPCGCYYVLFPYRGLQARQPVDGSEPVLTPFVAPQTSEGERLTIRLAHLTHYIEQVYPSKTSGIGLPYRLAEYDQLRALPQPEGAALSLFDQRGLLTSSARSERFILWPMGVPSPGAMRQWGTHAIAFVGRRHFDDAWLLEGLLMRQE